MKLSDYLERERLSDADFAEMIGRDRSAVTKWRNARARPDWKALAAIKLITKGKVSANDFLPSADAAG